MGGGERATHAHTRVVRTIFFVRNLFSSIHHVHIQDDHNVSAHLMIIL